MGQRLQLRGFERQAAAAEVLAEGRQVDAAAAVSGHHPVLGVGDAGRLDGPDLLELHIRVHEVVEETSTVAAASLACSSADSISRRAAPPREDQEPQSVPRNAV